MDYVLSNSTSCFCNFVKGVVNNINSIVISNPIMLALGCGMTCPTDVSQAGKSDRINRFLTSLHSKTLSSFEMTVDLFFE
jgi:hypothetical protein